MLFSFLLGSPKSGARRTRARGPRRPAPYRPRLEVLEERLPPGDAVLGGLLARLWLESGFPAADPALPAAAPALGEKVLTKAHRALAAPDGPGPRPDPARALAEGTRPESAGPSGGVIAPGSAALADPVQEFSAPWPAAADRAGVGDFLRSPWFAAVSQVPALGGNAPPDGSGRTPPVQVPEGARGAPAAEPSAPGVPAVWPGQAPAREATPAGLVAAAGSRSRAAPAVHARFDLGATAGGPFPSDRFTVADDTQNTGRRVNLPLPDPAARLSDYQDTLVLNTLDGFNLQPRLSVPFDGPIDVTTVTSETVFLVSLGDTLDRHDRGGQVVGINQVVWDVATTTLHVESDELLEQHTRYALVVTSGVHDLGGNPVEASEAFRRFRQAVRGDYKQDLLDAVHAARRLGVREDDVVAASVFTTQSATAVLEKIRDQIHAATPAPADFLLGPGGTRTVFDLDAVSGITFNRHMRVDPPAFSPVSVNLAALQIFPGAVGTIAFGKYLSPDYQTHPGEFIPPVGTRTGTPQVQGTNEIYFNLILPSGPTPAGGWPVAIYGHGINGNKNEWLPLVAASMASQGVATIGINAVGTGFGPLSTLTVNRTAGGSVTFTAGGRAFDQNGDGMIPNFEGLRPTELRTIIGQADALRQTAVDLMQLVRVTEAGMDVDGDGSRDLDPSRLYYFGNSFGGEYGTLFLAVEPGVRAGVLNVPGGTPLDWTPTSGRRSAEVGGELAARTPPLINSPGITSIEGVPVNAPHFNENLPLRDGLPLRVRLADGTSHVIQSPVTNTVPGAMAIQEALENREWVHMFGDPVAYAPHLRKDPLVDVPAKSVLIQFARGDQNVTNPRTTALLRAGDLADRATLYRHDLAFAENPALPKNPHQFLILVDSPAVRPVALGYQAQIATFFASDGTVVIHPEPSRFFEVPIQGPLPEGLNYLP